MFAKRLYLYENGRVLRYLYDLTDGRFHEYRSLQYSVSCAFKLYGEVPQTARIQPKKDITFIFEPVSLHYVSDSLLKIKLISLLQTLLSHLRILLCVIFMDIFKYIVGKKTTIMYKQFLCKTFLWSVNIKLTSFSQ